MSFARTDQSVLGRWWWTVDRWQLVAVALLTFYMARATVATAIVAAGLAAAMRFI